MNLQLVILSSPLRMCVVGIKCVRFKEGVKMSSESLHCDSALKRKVITYVEKHGNGAERIHLSQVKQMFVVGGMIETPYFLAKHPQSTLLDISQEDAHK